MGAHLLLLGGAIMDGPRHLFWNIVAPSHERIEQAKADWKAGRFAKVPGAGDEAEFITLPEVRVAASTTPQAVAAGSPTSQRSERPLLAMMTSQAGQRTVSFGSSKDTATGQTARG